MAIRDEVILVVKQHLGEDAQKPGAVLYNGWDTLRPSNDGLYIMGFNPGGDSETSVIKSLEELNDKYCSYEDECWGCKIDCQQRDHYGKHRHQRNVRELAMILGRSVRCVFSANAIFIRSKTQGDLKECPKLFEKCWPIHKRFLSIVKPRIILCLGNKEDLSAFALLREMLAIEPNQVRRCGHVKAFSSAIAVSDRETINSHVIGVRHPSQPWFNPVEELRLYLTQENPDVMAGKRWSEV